MPSVSASVLIVGHPHPESVKFGADFIPSMDHLNQLPSLNQFAVTVLSIPPSDHAKGAKVLSQLGNNHPLGQKIVIHHSSSGEMLKTYIDQSNIFRFLSSFDDPRFERTVQEALEEFDLLQQNEELMSLIQEQNETLKRLGSELEERVKKRQKSLQEAEKKLRANHQKALLLHKAMVAIHSSSSFAMMEHQITEALKPNLHLLWTRIIFPILPLESFIEEDKSIQTLRLPLFEGQNKVGQVCFARSWDRPFTREETNFLTHITEAISLATRRLDQLAQSENLKSQWEATFDAISEPLAVVDSQYNIRRANRAYIYRCGGVFEQVVGQKCYKMLFQRSNPCPGCQLGRSFRRTDPESQNHQVLDVQSQNLGRDPDDPTFLQIYSDISEKLRLERQVLESSKMAELGTIGSSIAHELNNPLGGILNFIQLIKMDLPADDPHSEDIKEMEAAALKCKSIIENLLGFSRRSDLHELRLISLQEVLAQAIQIVEIKSRPLGVQIKTRPPKENFQVQGRFNLLSQAIHNLLQNAFEAIASKMRNERGFKGTIEVSFEEMKNNQVSLHIVDNGVGLTGPAEVIFTPLYSTKDPEKHSGLGLSVARQILHEHGGGVRISKLSDGRTEAVIHLPLAPL